MKCYSTEFEVPDTCPFNIQETWFQSFVGSVIVPTVNANQLGRFWFTRYGAVGKGKTALFRFETDHFVPVLQGITTLIANKGIVLKGHSEYDVGGDIGRGQGSRFLGHNAKHNDQDRRGDLALTFLHAAANLMIDSLVGPDASGYFTLEAETASGFSKETSLEQFHHLFCNMTCVPTYMAIAKSPDSDDLFPITYEEYKKAMKLQGWQLGVLRKGDF